MLMADPEPSTVIEVIDVEGLEGEVVVTSSSLPSPELTEILSVEQLEE